MGLLFWRFSGSGGFSYEQLEVLTVLAVLRVVRHLLVPDLKAALKEERSAASEHLLLRSLPAQPLAPTVRFQRHWATAVKRDGSNVTHDHETSFVAQFCRMRRSLHRHLWSIFRMLTNDMQLSRC